MGENEPQDGEWLPVSTAARRLGISPRALRGRIDRGTVQWKQAGNTGKLVLIRPEDVAAEEDRDASQDEMDRLRDELAEERIGRARAEERAAALREALDREQARADRLEAELRRPWWRKLTGR